MFNDQNKTLSKNTYKIQTLIGQQCNIIGSLSGTGLIQINGSIDGDIYWDEDIVLGETCTCSGNISCINAHINGKVIGNITCKGTLTIESCGQIHGDIQVNKLVITEGGILEGKSTMPISEYCENLIKDNSLDFVNTSYE